MAATSIKGAGQTERERHRHHHTTCDSLCKNIGTSAVVAPIAVLFFVIDAMVVAVVVVVECAISPMLFDVFLLI